MKRKVKVKKVGKKKTAMKKRANGRPSKYKEEFAEQAKKLCMLLRAEDKQIAEFFGVSLSTVTLWKKEHPEFSASIREGKDVADTQVARSLFDRAVGYYHDDIYFSNYQGKVMQTKHKTYVPPDTKAIIFWLKYRQKLNWRDVFAHTDGAGDPLTIIIHDQPKGD